MNKDKLDKIKNKIKEYAPVILVLATAATAVVGMTYAIKKDLESMNEGIFDPLPEVTGDEREELLGREDTVIQKIEDDLYFLSIVQKPEDEN